MPLAKCVRCDDLFDKRDIPVCPACLPEEEEDQEKVRAIVEAHPDLSADAVAGLGDVELQVVMRMLDQGLVTNVSQSLGKSKCGRCGAPAISASKKLCTVCLEKLNQNVLKQRRELSLETKKNVELGGASSVREMIEEKRR